MSKKCINIRELKMTGTNDALYCRQELIPGWDQDRLSNKSVLVSGSGILAQDILINLAGLGIEHLILMSEKRIKMTQQDNILFNKFLKTHWNDYKLDHIVESLYELNPNLNGNVNVFHSRFSSSRLRSVSPDIVVDTTNNPITKRELLAYSVRHNIPFLSGSSGQFSGGMSSYNFPDVSDVDNDITHTFVGESQGVITSGIIAGLIADDVRKYFLPLSDTDTPLKPKDIVLYSLDCSVEEIMSGYGPRKNALVIGAGAIANPLVSELALLDAFNIDIMDGDEVSYHNLSRQFNFRGMIGRNKAESLARRAKEANPEIKVTPITRYFTSDDEDLFSSGDYDIVFGAVDKIEVRQLINEYATRHSAIYVDGGTSYTGGQVQVYMPGKTRCVDCQSDFDAIIRSREKKRGTSGSSIIEEGCLQAAPSVIIPNFIIGSAMVAEGLKALGGGDEFQRFNYNTFREGRISSSPLLYRKDCGSCGGI